VSDIWLIETLAGLRDHAAEHGLTHLAERLDEAIDLAHLEIAAQQARGPVPAQRKHQHDDLSLGSD
jgi:hypothetical protein